MVDSHFLKARVASDTKQLVQAAAQRQLVTESVWLRQVVLRPLSNEADVERAAVTTDRCERRRLGAKVSVRLHPEDQLLLGERSAARGMAPATYVSVLVRAHLRHLAPLPKDELMALKRSIAELGALGRNINQIARAATQGDRVALPGREDLRAFLKVCEDLRDHIKALVTANVATWEAGYAKQQAARLDSMGDRSWISGASPVKGSDAEIG